MKNSNTTGIKKILMALAITTMAYAGATAQTKTSCVKDEKKVCRPSADKNGVSCYETKNALNYKVCKGAAGYYICCDHPTDAAMAGTQTTYGNYDVSHEAVQEENRGTAIAAARGDENAKQVCKKGAGGKTECYKTDYAKNYQVCKGNTGYHVCGTPATLVKNK